MKKRVLCISIQAMLGGYVCTQGTVFGDAPEDYMVSIPIFVPNPTTVIRVINEPAAGTPVKVRFRGAANSDDVMDFRLFLSTASKWQGATND